MSAFTVTLLSLILIASMIQILVGVLILIIDRRSSKYSVVPSIIGSIVIFIGCILTLTSVGISYTMMLASLAVSGIGNMSMTIYALLGVMSGYHRCKNDNSRNLDAH